MSDPTFEPAEIERLRERLAATAQAIIATYWHITDKLNREIGLAVVTCREVGEVELGNAFIDLYLLRKHEKQAEAASVLRSLVAELDLLDKPIITDPSRN